MLKPYQTFEARAFHPDLGGEAQEGVIRFSPLALAFEGNGNIIAIPLQHLIAELDGAGEWRVIFRDSHQPGWTIATSDMDVLEVRDIPQIARLADELSAALTRREMSRRVKLVVGFGVGCVLIFWLAMLGTGVMVRSIVARVPPEVEQRLGDEMLAELKQEITLASDTNEVVRVAETFKPLLDSVRGRHEWQFYLAEEDAPNAFALPGGHIVLTRGLLDLSDRPEQVLGVIAHEIAHVTHKHGFRQQIASAGPFLVVQIFVRGRGGALGALAGGSALLVHQSFSQQYEKEADDIGWKYLVAANIDPRGMIEMLGKLQAYDASQGEADSLPKAFSSHPDMAKRIARLEAKWKRLKRKSGFMELKADMLADQ